MKSLVCIVSCFVLCYVKGNRFTQFMETPRKRGVWGECSVNLSHFKLNINKSNWKHFTFEPGNPLFEKTWMSDCISTLTSFK